MQETQLHKVWSDCKDSGRNHRLWEETLSSACSEKVWASRTGSSSPSLLPVLGGAHQNAGQLNDDYSTLSLHSSLDCTAGSGWSRASNSEDRCLQEHHKQSVLQQAWSQPWTCTFKGYLQQLHTLPAQTRTNCFAIELLRHSQCPKLLKIK